MFKIIVYFFIAIEVFANNLVLKTGQTVEYHAGDDGTYHSLTGIERSYSRDDINGIVNDYAAKLQWQDSFENGEGYRADWHEAKNYCSNLNLNGRGWRLPTRTELRTIVDYSQENPAVNTDFFKEIISALYWSETTFAGNKDVAWRTNFNDGGDYISFKDSHYFVRCVRNMQ